MSIEEKAMAAQRRVIATWLLSNVAGGGRRLEKWNDHYYYLAWFRTWATAFGDTPLHKVRRDLAKLVESGVIEKHQYREGGALGFRFPREICDQIAAEVSEAYRAKGFVDGKIVSISGDRYEIIEVQPCKSPNPMSGC